MFDKFFKKHKFKESKNQAVFTCCHIIEENKPILYVKHDNEGDWQFLCGDNHTTEDARVIALQEIINIDPSVSKVSSLKCGQTAVRESKESEWKLL
ncbi:MAG: hypothetical protein E7615_02165 [Ruminococcaceae bacterium]|nr:hypothetical protein [Oscillospiraceae bacterium]